MITRPEKGSLVDRGANGGVEGDDVRVIAQTDKKVAITGLGDHTVSGLSVVTAGAVAESTDGEVIVVLNQYAHAPKGKTIHSCIQLEAFDVKVDDKSRRLVGGKQEITTPGGYTFPLNIQNGTAISTNEAVH